ncbi:MAG: mechanosensitive ion channel domain-containing protein [Burkholderiales bacterium]
MANLLAGVLILLYRPFDVGDHIDFAETEQVLVPNGKLLTDPIRVAKTPPATQSSPG